MTDKNNKIKRPEGQFARNFKVILDINSRPKGIDAELWLKLMDRGMIVYDSTEGNRPKLYEVGTASGEDVIIPALVDAKGKEVNIDDFNKKLEDEEFWRKELYKCKQSPLYYFTQYGSTELKPSQEAITKFLKDTGFEAKADSDDAAVITERTRKIREKFSSTITLEKLQDLKPVRDSMDAEYEAITMELRVEFGEKHDVSPTHDAEIRRRVVTSIMKTKTKDAPESLRMYVLPKSGRWDKSLFNATDLDVLLRLWKDM